ncbi:uncharacterized protein LOC135185523 [Pogoniulus pusillus]|uniref:uncharacterized protein LOC135185523 n=1 Tax=Pogoniulus pusillus TaxID=488313 RepID=UPI0030B93BDE
MVHDLFENTCLILENVRVFLPPRLAGYPLGKAVGRLKDVRHLGGKREGNGLYSPYLAAPTPLISLEKHCGCKSRGGGSCVFDTFAIQSRPWKGSLQNRWAPRGRAEAAAASLRLGPSGRATTSSACEKGRGEVNRCGPYRNPWNKCFKPRGISPNSEIRGRQISGKRIPRYKFLEWEFTFHPHFYFINTRPRAPGGRSAGTAFLLQRRGSPRNPAPPSAGSWTPPAAGSLGRLRGGGGRTASSRPSPEDPRPPSAPGPAGGSVVVAGAACASPSPGSCPRDPAEPLRASPHGFYRPQPQAHGEGEGRRRRSRGRATGEPGKMDAPVEDPEGEAGWVPWPHREIALKCGSPRGPSRQPRRPVRPRGAAPGAAEPGHSGREKLVAPGKMAARGALSPGPAAQGPPRRRAGPEPGWAPAPRHCATHFIYIYTHIYI